MLAPDIVAVLDCVDDGVAVLDARGRLRHANAAGARLFGFATPAALVAASPTEIGARCAVFDESGAPVSVASLTDAPVSPGDGPEVVWRVRVRTTDEERWVAVRATPMDTADGARIEVRVFRDVSDRVRAEAQARERLTWNRAILAALPDLLFLQTPDGTYLDYHAGDPAQLLVPPEAFLGKTAREVLPPQVAGRLVPALERTARTGVPSEEHYALEVGGEERSYEARLVRVADGNVLSVVRDVTDRVRAEAALAESRRLADRVAAASPAILYVFDAAEDRNVYVNDALPRLLGYTPEQLIQAGVADLWALMHPDDLARWPEMGAQVAAAADGEVVEHGFRLRHADGGWRWLTQRVTVLSRQPDGRPHLIVGAALDVTDLRDAETALRESEARYRAVVNSQTEMICRFTSDTTVTFVNDAYCRIFARTREDILGQRILDLAPEPIRQRLAAHFRTLVAEGRPVEIEHTFERPDGTIRVQHWIDYPVYDTLGTVTEYQGIGRDVTELTRAEQELAASRRLADRVGAASPDILYVYDVLTGRTIYVNDAIERVLGYSAAEHIAAEATDPTAMRHPEDGATLRAAVARVAAAADGDVVEFAFRMRHADGGWRWLAARVTVLSREPDGRPRQVVGALLDVTDLRRTEEDLRQLSGRLLAVQDEERRRLAHALHAQLAGTLVGLSLGVSSARLRLGEAAAPEVDRLLADAEALGQRALREVRTVSYALHPPDLDEVGLTVALRGFAAEFGRRSGVAVDLAGVDDVGPLPEDAEVALFRVAQEALTNVARHAGTDRATVALSARRGEVTLRVADNGRGMVGGGPSDAVPLGVGIAGMRARVRQLGGTLDIASDAGGTVVSARLPRVGGNGTRPRRRRVAAAGGGDAA